MTKIATFAILHYLTRFLLLDGRTSEPGGHRQDGGGGGRGALVQGGPGAQEGRKRLQGKDFPYIKLHC